MGKKSKRAAKSQPPLSPQAELQRSAWAKRHPDIARAERAMRVARHDRQKRYSHKRGPTPETLDKFNMRRPGAMLRLHQSGAINLEQLAAAEEISLVAERIMSDVTVRTANLEPQIPARRYGEAFWEKLGTVRMEVAYSRWRAELGPLANLVLPILLDEQSITAAAAEARMGTLRTRKLLIDAIDLWIRKFSEARKQIGRAELLEAQLALQ